MKANENDYRKANGSGYWLNGSKWWAVVRETTMNILVGTYETMEEAKEVYEQAQSAWDNDRVSVCKWKEGSHRCRS
jgi:hypothetical protein